MSDPTDIKALDEYLKGDSDVSQRYRELGRDEVPPELDRRVLAAARDAVANEGAKRSRSWPRWSAPVALAASIVLVLTVVLENGVQNDTTLVTQSPRDKATSERAEAKLAEEVARQPGSVSEVSVSGSRSPTLQANVPPPPEPQVVNIERFREVVIPPPEVTVAQDAAPSAIASVAAPAAPPAAEQAEPMAARKSVERSEAEAKAEGESDADADADSPDEAQERGLAGATRRATGSRAGPRTGVSSSALTRETRPASDDRAERSDPQAWLKEIRELRRTGKRDEADREWQRFREAFPDFHVADDDIAPSKP